LKKRWGETRRVIKSKEIEGGWEKASVAAWTKGQKDQTIRSKRWPGLSGGGGQKEGRHNVRAIERSEEGLRGARTPCLRTTGNSSSFACSGLVGTKGRKTSFRLRHAKECARAKRKEESSGDVLKGDGTPRKRKPEGTPINLKDRFTNSPRPFRAKEGGVRNQKKK